MTNTKVIKSVVAFFIIINTSLALGQYDQLNYYPDHTRNRIESSNIKNESLKSTLFEVLTKKHIQNSFGGDELTNQCSGPNCYSHQTLTYSQARKFLFGQLHIQRSERGYFIKDVYCHKNFNKSSGVGPMRIPNSNIINCEHTWPQSKFSNRFSKSIQKSDLHHLFPTDSRANSTRGNYPFAEVNGMVLGNNCDSSSIGSPTQTYKFSSTYFEPPIEHRGNVARALFYFSVRYQIKINITQETYLKKWHEEDPVDQNEIIRNNEIMDIQGNRNPFIDFPHIVSDIQDF